VKIEQLRGDRFPPLAWDDLTPSQRAMMTAVGAGSRPSLDGPFNALLRSPEMGNLAQALGEYLRFRAAMPPRLRELAILLTARHWLAQFEWHAHAPLAREAGLADTVIDDIHAGRQPAHLLPDEAVVYGFVSELRGRRRVSDATFRAAVDVLGEAGVIDLIGLMGYYDLVAMILNVDRYPLPDGAGRPFDESD
jgi:4-carboxymuconolactone decarboxylase